MYTSGNYAGMLQFDNYLFIPVFGPEILHAVERARSRQKKGSGSPVPKALRLCGRKRKLSYSPLYSIAFINERKIILLYLSVLKENSGCHCTAHRYVLSSIKTASTSPSGEMAIGFRPGASSLTA